MGTAYTWITINPNTGVITVAPDDSSLVFNTYPVSVTLAFTGDYANRPTLTKTFSVYVASCSLTSVSPDSTLGGSVTYVTAGSTSDPISWQAFTHEPAACNEFVFEYTAVLVDNLGNEIGTVPDFLTFDPDNH